MLAKSRNLAAFALFAAAGCGAGEKTYPVKGALEIARGEVAALSGSVIEAVLEGNPAVRASGEISGGGQFALESLQSGRIVKGAPPGVYKVRIVLADDDKAARRLAAKSIAPRFLKFETSGMTFTVPSSEPIVLKATKT